MGQDRVHRRDVELVERAQQHQVAGQDRLTWNGCCAVGSVTVSSPVSSVGTPLLGRRATPAVAPLRCSPKRGRLRGRLVDWNAGLLEQLFDG